ncbi:MAG: beta-lactamase family protein [Clostridia bacterium]|nr:beta-lactamase family protein [Clostridia bacterium]
MDFTNVKNFMDHLTSWIIPGNSIVIYKDNEQVFSYQSGYADLENKIPMRGGELFHIYSCSKPLTVVAALQLYERGKFLLDDPISNFISEFREMTVREESGAIIPAKRPITMRHLLTMTGGFDYNTNLNVAWRKRAMELTNGRMDTLTVARCIAAEPLCAHPGEKWVYSLGLDVLAAVVEVIAGQKFRDYVKENIFEPLDMQDSCYHATEEINARMAQHYRYDVENGTDAVLLQAGLLRSDTGKVANPGKKNHLVFGNEYDSGGAGIITSIEDYAKFGNALANGGVGKTGAQILGSGTIDLMRADHLRDPAIDRTDFDSWATHIGHSYGFGVMTMTDRAKSGSNGSFGEFSWGGAAGGTLHVDPDRHLAYFYAHHMLNPQEIYYQPRLRNVVNSCF